MCLQYKCFLMVYSQNYLSSSTLFRTSSFDILSVHLIFYILFQYLISKLYMFIFYFFLTPVFLTHKVVQLFISFFLNFKLRLLVKSALFMVKTLLAVAVYDPISFVQPFVTNFLTISELVNTL